MSREELLSQKGQEIQEALTQWAQEVSLLGPGEQVVFSVRIEQTPLVVASDDLLDLALPRFFTKERCEKIFGATTLPARVRNQLHHHAHIGTVRELLNIPRGEIRKLHNVGNITLQQIDEVLATEGLRMSG